MLALTTELKAVTKSLCTGITDDMVAKKPTFKEVFKTVKKYFKGTVVTGYNIHSFDLPILKRQIRDETYTHYSMTCRLSYSPPSEASGQTNWTPFKRNAAISQEAHKKQQTTALDASISFHIS